MRSRGGVFRESLETLEALVVTSHVGQGSARVLEPVRLRLHWALLGCAILLFADTVTKLLNGSDGTCVASADGTHGWCVPAEHVGKAASFGWGDLILLGFLLLPFTRIPAAVAAAGVIGNTAWALTGSVPNPYQANGADGVGLTDWPWVHGDYLVAYNLADVFITLGFWAILGATVFWSVRLFVRVWGAGYTSTSGVRSNQSNHRSAKPSHLGRIAHGR